MYYIIKTKSNKIKTITAAYLANRLKKNGTSNDPIVKVSNSFSGSMPRGEDKKLPRVKKWIDVSYIPKENLDLISNMNKYYEILKFKFGSKVNEYEEAIFEGKSLIQVKKIIDISKL